MPAQLVAAATDEAWLVERGGGLPDLASRHALDQAIAKGRGGIFLNLTPDQYAQLRQRR